MDASDYNTIVLHPVQQVLYGFDYLLMFDREQIYYNTSEKGVKEQNKRNFP